MRICVPTENDGGLDAPLSGHFGSAPYYTIKDTDTGSLESVSNQEHAHAHGQCAPVEWLTPHHLDAILVGGIGKRAFLRLKQAGLLVYLTDRKTVRDALAELDGGRLKEPAVDQICGGHGHKHRDRGCGSAE